MARFEMKSAATTRKRDHRIYMRNRVTGEVRKVWAGSDELQLLRSQWHPQIPHMPLWEQVYRPESKT